MSALIFILKNLDHFRRRFFVMLGVAFADGVVTFLIPILLSEFTKTDLSVDSFRVLVPYIVGCFLGSLGLQWILRKHGESLARQYGNYLRLKYFTIVEHLSLRILSKFHSGYLFSLISKICDGSTQLMSSCIWLIAHSVATLSLFFIYTAHESLFIAVLNLLMLILFMVISVFLSQKMVPIVTALNFKHAAFIERYVDLMTNIFTVKKLGLYQFAETQIAEKVDDNAQQIQALQTFHANRWFLLHAIYGIAFLSTISFLLFQISQHVVPASVLILFISAYAVIRGSIERLSELVKDLMELNAYTNSLNAIRAESLSVTGGKIVGAWNTIELRDISFLYPENQKRILIPHFSLRRAEKVCITGESGQGKSTLLGILGGFLDLGLGTRLLDDNSYEQYSADSLTKLFALIAQDIELFNVSVRTNLCLGAAIPDDQILEILDKLNLMSWMKQLPHGLDTVVGEKGFKLSSGQRQRLNIARGILLDRDILFFDEPTSHLDEKTERIVTEFLATRLEHKTAVVVTHRPAVMKLCSRSYWFEGGVLVGD